MIEFQHSASMASLPSITGFSEAISEAEEIESVKRLQEQGDAAFHTKDFAKAVACYGEALEIDSDNANLLERKAVSNLELREYGEARTDAEYLIKLNPHVPQGHYLLAVSLHNLHAYIPAIGAFLNALHYDIKHRDRLADNIAVVATKLCKFAEKSNALFADLTPAEKLLEVGVNLKRANENASCIEVLQCALDLKTLDEPRQERALYNIGAAFAACQDYKSATDYHKQCLAVALSLKNQKREAEVYCRLAEICLKGENLEQGIVYYEKLLSICKELETLGKEPASCDAEVQRLVHETLCNAYTAVSNLPRAMNHAVKNLESLVDSDTDTDRINSRDLFGKAHFTVATLHEAVGNLVLALKHFKSFLAITKSAHDRAGMAKAYGCIGRVHHKLSNFPLFLSFYEQQLYISDKLSYPSLQASALRSLADVYEDLGDGDKSLECLQKHLLVSRKLDEFSTECRAFIAIGEFHWARGKLHHAEHFYEQALNLAKRSHENKLAYVSRRKVAEVLLFSQDVKVLEKAKTLAGESIDYYTNALKDVKGNEEKILQSLDESYILIQVALKKLGRPYNALEYAETHMRRGFLKTVAKRSASLGLDGDPVEDALSSSASMEDMLKVVNRESTTVVYLSLCHSCILSWVFKPREGCWTGRDDQDTMIQDCPRHVQELVQSMRTSESETEDVYDTEFRALPLPDSKMHQLKTKNFLRLKPKSKAIINEESKSNLTTESPSRTLYKLILSPVEHLLDGGCSVVIVADQILSQVPFDALEDNDGRPFNDKHRVTVLPCIEALKYTRVSNDTEKETRNQSGEDTNRVQISPTHPVYLDHMLRVVIPGKEQPHSIINDQDAQAPQMSLNRPNPTYVVFNRNTYNFTQKPRAELATTEERFIQASEMSGSTLISQTWSGNNLASASQGIVENYQQQCKIQKALIVGNPTLPKKLLLHGRIWEPSSELSAAQHEAHTVARYLNTDAVVGSKVTKETLLAELTKATFVHLDLLCVELAAMYGSWEQASLACSPNSSCKPLPNDFCCPSTYIIGVDDIVGLELQAKIVVMSCCYGNRHRDVQLQLPFAFLVAGAESVLFLLWSVPDIVRNKFWYHFYEALQEGCHVTQAVAHAKSGLRQDKRFQSVCYWGAFCLLGRDPFISLVQLKHAMLDNLLNVLEADYLEGHKQGLLNIREQQIQDEDAESLQERLRRNLSGLLLHHTMDADTLPHMISLLRKCLRAVNSRNENASPPLTQPLPQCIINAPSAILLLNQLGFHFQMGTCRSGTHTPQVLFSQWDPDGLMEPALEALTGIQDIGENRVCAHNLARVLEGPQQLLSRLIDVMSLTKHVPEAQLRVSDAGVSHLWGHAQARALLLSIGFSQVGQLLMFNGTASNKALLQASLEVLCSVMGEKGQAMKNHLDVSYLGISTPGSHSLGSARKTPIKSALRSASTARTLTPTAVRLRTAPVAIEEPSLASKSLPSLNPVKIPHNKLAFSTPWWSQPTKKSPAITEKLRLVRSLSDLHTEYAGHIRHTSNWHLESLTPEAKKSMSAIGQPRPRPQVLKVKAGATPSCLREPVSNQSGALSMEAVEQRRDYSHFVLHARHADVERRHVDTVRKLFKPYVSQKTAGI